MNTANEKNDNEARPEPSGSQSDGGATIGAGPGETTGSPRSRKRRATNTKIALPIIIAAAVVVLVLVLVPRGREQTVPTERRPVNVVTQIIRPIARLPDTFRVEAVVEANRIVEVAAEIDGRIEAYAARDQQGDRTAQPIPPSARIKGKTIDEGDAIDAGKAILHLNTDLLQADHDSAKAQLIFDEKEFRRVADARRKSVATPKEYDETQAKLAISKGTYECAVVRLRRATILAPISGIVDQLPLEVGEYVKVGETVAKIVDIDTVKVVAHVSERNVHFLHLGDKATISIDSLDGARETGPITYISELADELTRTTRVEITVDNPASLQGKRRLRSGQIVTVELTRRILQDPIMIPLAAVIPLESGYVVYIVNDSKAQQRQVELGFIKGYSVRVLSGLDPGDRLIVSGHHYVGPGQKVTEPERR